MCLTTGATEYRKHSHETPAFLGLCQEGVTVSHRIRDLLLVISTAVVVALFALAVTPTSGQAPARYRVEYPMRKNPERMSEYACQEGNYALQGILAGARGGEKAAAEAAKKSK